MRKFLPSTGSSTEDAVAIPLPQAGADRKVLDLAVLKKGAKDFLSFVDESKEVFYAYLYHRTGSVSLAQTLLGELYLNVLSRAMALWWFGTLSLSLLLDTADKAIEKGITGSEADLDTVYVPTLTWLNDDERKSASSLHESLWTLPATAQKLLTLSLLMGFPQERIAKTLGLTPEQVQVQLQQATDLLLAAWQPIESLKKKIASLVFEPDFDINKEASLRFTIVEKYNALRMRRYQWVIVGGFLAVFANIIVAGVLAFVVVVQSPTSIRGAKTQVAALDVILLQRQLSQIEAKKALSDLLPQSRGLAAYGAARDLTSVGLSAGLNAFDQQNKNEADIGKIIKVLQRASTAMGPILRPIASIVLSPVRMAVDVARAIVE